MNFYAGTLILNCKNVDAFNILSYLLTVPVIKACFSVDMNKLAAYGNVLEELLLLYVPKVAKYLKASGYQYQTYIFDSGASLFYANFSYFVASEIWDAILDSPEIGLFRVGVTVFKTLEKELLTMRADEVMMAVKFPCQHTTEEVFLKTLSKTEIKVKDFLRIKQKAMDDAKIL